MTFDESKHPRDEKGMWAEGSSTKNLATVTKEASKHANSLSAGHADFDRAHTSAYLANKALSERYHKEADMADKTTDKGMEEFMTKRAKGEAHYKAAMRHSRKRSLGTIRQQATAAKELA